MGRERYRRLPRTVARTLCGLVLLVFVGVSTKDFLTEHARRQATLANSRVRCHQLLALSAEHRLATQDLASLCDDLERNAKEQEAAGDDAAAESFRRQAERKRGELGDFWEQEALLEEWSRYHSRMIERYERAVRLPLSRLGPDPAPPPLALEGMASNDWQSKPPATAIPIPRAR